MPRFKFKIGKSVSSILNSSDFAADDFELQIELETLTILQPTTTASKGFTWAFNLIACDVTKIQPLVTAKQNVELVARSAAFRNDDAVPVWRHLRKREMPPEAPPATCVRGFDESHENKAIQEPLQQQQHPGHRNYGKEIKDFWDFFPWFNTYLKRR